MEAHLVSLRDLFILALSSFASTLEYESCEQMTKVTEESLANSNSKVQVLLSFWTGAMAVQIDTHNDASQSAVRSLLVGHEH
jgi:hypothetical protein